MVIIFLLISSSLSVSDSKFSQLSRVLQSIPPDFNIAVVWMVIILLIFSSPSVSDSRFSQLSSVLQSIPPDFNIAVIWLSLSFFWSLIPFVSFQGIRKHSSKSTIDNWHHQNFQIPKLFQLSSEDEVFAYLFAFFPFQPVVCWNTKIN